MKHFCYFFALLMFTNIALSKPTTTLPDVLSFKTSDWIDTSKVNDYLQAQVTVKKIAPGVYWAAYVSDGSFSENAATYNGSAFGYFNFCLGEYLASRNNKRYWQLGFDKHYETFKEAGPSLNTYFIVKNTKSATQKMVGGHDIEWGGDTATRTGTFKQMCSRYLRTSYQ